MPGLASPTGRNILMMPRQAPAPAAPPQFVTDWGVISRWSLNETSGSRGDTWGPNTLSDNNSVPGTTGKVDGAALFDRVTNQFLSCPSSSGLVMGAEVDFWGACWFSLETRALLQTILGKGTTGTTEWHLLVNASDQVRFGVSNDGTALIYATETVVIADSNPHFALFWHDAVGNTTNLKVDNGTTRTTAHTTGVLAGAGAFEIGRRGDSTAARLDGWVDEAVIGRAPPGGVAGIIATINTTLWNSGAGKRWPYAA